MLIFILGIVGVRVIIARVVAVVVAIGLWLWTQALLGKRKAPTIGEGGAICDGIHQLTARINARLLKYPKRADALLISSSLVIDLLGFYVLGLAIFGHTIEPFLGLFILFALRQFCQAFCPLPPPAGMIWRDPGFPTILVTYGTANDLFFSGHTAIAVYGAVILGGSLGPVGMALGGFIIAFEVSVVLLLRAHYTMDVFTGAITALYVHRLAADWAPVVDKWIAHFT